MPAEQEAPVLKVVAGPVARVAPAGPVGPGVSVESEESEEEIRVQTSLSPFSLVDRQLSLLKTCSQSHLGQEPARQRAIVAMTSER